MGEVYRARDSRLAREVALKILPEGVARDPERVARFALLRRPQDAFHWLEHAVEAGFINYPFLTRDRLLDSLRGEERFERLMERVKREWEAFDA